MPSLCQRGQLTLCQASVSGGNSPYAKPLLAGGNSPHAKPLLAGATHLNQCQEELLLREASAYTRAGSEAEGHDDEGVDVGMGGRVATQPALWHEPLRLLDVLLRFARPVMVQTRYHLDTQDGQALAVPDRAWTCSGIT